MTIKSKRSYWIAGTLALLLVGGIGLVIIATKEQSELDMLLAAFGNDVNAVNKHGDTALHLAATGSFGGSETVQFLVDKGADVNAKCNNGSTALCNAVGNGEIEIVKFLISKGADVNVMPKHGAFTMLHIAAASAKMEIVELLISAGADVNAANAGGYTPLHATTAPSYMPDGTVQYADVEITKFLVSAGADVNAKNNDGKTPLDTAIENGHTIAVEYLSSIR